MQKKRKWKLKNKNISTKFDKMAENDKKLQNSQNQTDSQIKTNTKNKYKTLQLRSSVVLKNLNKLLDSLTHKLQLISANV